MPDVHSKETRSFNMSRIRGSNTKPEELVRKYLFSRGLRYRKNDKRLPGKPDIVLPKYRAVVFVHGCYWHRHPGCRYAATPKTNANFWREKLDGNVIRDEVNVSKLEAEGWRVFVVWECDLHQQVREKNLRLLYDLITNQSESVRHALLN